MKTMLVHLTSMVEGLLSLFGPTAVIENLYLCPASNSMSFVCLSFEMSIGLAGGFF